MPDMNKLEINGVIYDVRDPTKAPAGYGLGGQGTLITDCNITHSGFYKFDDGTWNRPFDYGTLIVSGRHDGNCNQIAICHDGTDKGCIAVRQYGANLDDGWEFLNPRMTLDTEYRTTERYNGKPVYVKLVNCGYLPESPGTKQVVFLPNGNAQDIVRHSAEVRTDDGAQVFSLPYTLNSINWCVQAIGKNAINLYVSYSASGYVAYVTVWYTKA